MDLIGRANIDLWEAGWTQKEIEIMIFGKIKDKREVEFKGRTE